MPKEAKVNKVILFLKQLAKGGAKSIPIAGGLIEEMIFGTLEEFAAKEESEKLNVVLSRIQDSMEGAEESLVEILERVTAETRFQVETTARIEELIFSLQQEGTRQVSEAVEQSVDRFLEHHHERLDDVTTDLEQLVIRLENLVSRGRLAERYPALKDDTYDFSEIIASNTRWFVGRDSIFKNMEKFIAQHPCCYIHITADAGLGKTALAAEIARRNQASAFFTNSSCGLTNPDQCLKHLSADLITRFQLDYDRIPSNAGNDSTFLSRILTETSKQSNKPVWVVVDALDEASEPLPGQNPLLLPDHLPHGVYVVLTHRRGAYPLVTEPHTPVEEIKISWNDTVQRSDIETFLQRQGARKELRKALNTAEPSISMSSFVTTLRDASQGNFMFLEYVIADILHREEAGSPLNLDDLPMGLMDYYSRFWSGIATVKKEEGWAEWDGLYRPVIELLGVANEPVSVSWLADLVGRDPEEIREQAVLRWQRFLSFDRSECRETWRIVHKSFADFLSTKVDLTAMHQSVANFYRDKPDHWFKHDGYPQRHLSTHLSRAGNLEALFELVDNHNWYEAQIKTYPSGDTCLKDLNQVWRAAESVNAAFIKGEQGLPLLGREVHCALATASLQSMSENIPPPLLKSLLLAGHWTPAQGLAAVKQNPNEWTRIEGLVVITPFLDAPQIRKALKVARTIKTSWYGSGRPKMALSMRLAELDNYQEALAEARSIEEEGPRAEALAAIVPHIPETERKPVIKEILDTIRELPIFELFSKGEAPKYEALAKLLPYVSKTNQNALLRQAVQEVLDFPEEDLNFSYSPRASALSALAPHFSKSMMEKVLNKVRLIFSHPIPSKRVDKSRGQILVALAPYVEETERIALLKEALKWVQYTEIEVVQADLFSKIVLQFPEDEALPLLRKILKSLSDIDVADRMDLDTLIIYVALLAKMGHPEEALDAARHLDDPIKCAGALAEISPHLPATKRKTLLDEGLQAVSAIPDRNAMSITLAAFSHHLAQLGNTDEAFDAAMGIKDEVARSTALAKLGPSLIASQLHQAIESALTIRNDVARIGAVVSLAQLLPKDEGLLMIEKVIDDALALDENPVVRAKALTALIPGLDEAVRSSLVKEAIKTALSMSDTFRAEALTSLVPHLSEAERIPLLWEILKVESAYENVYGHGPAIIKGVVPYLPPQLLTEMFKIVKRKEDEGARGSGLAKLAPYLSESLLHEAVDVARTIEDELIQTKTLAGIVSHLPEDERDSMNAETLKVARSLRKHDLVSGQAREKSLVMLAPHVPEADRLSALKEALRIATSMDSTIDRSEMLGILAPALAELNISTLYSLWRETLHSLAIYSREELLAGFRALSPVIIKLGQAQGVEETIHAIQRVERWWPSRK